MGTQTEQIAVLVQRLLTSKSGTIWQVQEGTYPRRISSRKALHTVSILDSKNTCLALVYLNIEFPSICVHARDSFRSAQPPSRAVLAHSTDVRNDMFTYCGHRFCRKANSYKERHRKYPRNQCIWKDLRTGETQVVVTLRQKRDEIESVIAVYRKKLEAAERDLSAVAATLRLLELGDQREQFPACADISRLWKRGALRV